MEFLSPYVDSFLKRTNWFPLTDEQKQDVRRHLHVIRLQTDFPHARGFSSFFQKGFFFSPGSNCGFQTDRHGILKTTKTKNGSFPGYNILPPLKPTFRNDRKTDYQTQLVSLASTYYSSDSEHLFSPLYRFARLFWQHRIDWIVVDPFTPKSDQFQISPVASPEILLHHAVWRTRLFIWLTQMKDDYTTKFLLPPSHVSF